MAHKVLGCILLLALSSEGNDKSRWSRQLSSYTADISDWVPLPGPVEQEPLQIRRQSVAEPRVLSEPFPGFARPSGFSQEDFPPRPLFNTQSNRQLYLQAVPSAPQNYLSDQGFGQGLKFGLTQPNFPLSQGFVSPNFNFDSIPQIKTRPPVIPTVKFDSFTKPGNSQGKPYIGQLPKLKPDAPKFVDGYRVENISEIGMPKKKAPTLQKVKFDNFEKVKVNGLQNKPKTEREEVQLLYVPVESLNRGQFNFRSPLTSSQIVNTDFYNQNPRGNPLRQNLATEFQRPLPKPLESFNSQEALNDFNRQLIGFERESAQYSTITSPFTTIPSTTSKPQKLKPHQPPLAIFLSPEKKEESVKVGDVLFSLKNADTVPVLDSVNPLNAPKVFIGPSSLTPPEKYVKFELPYLSNIENIDKKLRQLPFFVAPLSYNTPQGFAKIPFPSPHVGSVVINSQIRETSTQHPTTTQILHETYENPYVRPQLYNRQQYQQQNPVTQKPQISYYSTVAPKVNPSPNHQQNYYSIEQQKVSTLAPLPSPQEPAQNERNPPKPGSYFLSNFRDQYNPSQYVNFPSEVNQEFPKRAQSYSIAPQVETTTTPRTTVSTTTKPSSTYASQLLETHNPYSINHAFHFNTPVDYQNFFEEYKETNSPRSTVSPTQTIVTSSTEASSAATIVDTQSTKQRFSQNYIQNYSPEIHYESEIQAARRPSYNTRDYATNIKNEATPRNEYNEPKEENYSYNNEQEMNNNNTTSTYQESAETKPVEGTNIQTVNYIPESTPEVYETANFSQQHSQYDTNNSNENLQPTESSSTTTSTTTTTRRSPLRTKGRPRYTTARTDSIDYTTRTAITRRPYRERKPLPNRSRFDPNKLTTEKTVKEEPAITTKPSRTRGRIHYRPTAGDDVSEKRPKQKDDLAYQRDVLHQNYPVTLMERTSTVDIDAITESTAKEHVTNAVDDSKIYDTENAYTNDKVSITANDNAELVRETYTPKDVSSETEIGYDQRDQTGRNEEDYFYQTKSSVTPSAFADDIVMKQSSEEERQQNQDQIYATSPVSPITEQNIPNYSANNEYPTEKEETAIVQEVDTTKVSPENFEEQDQEEQVIETTPSYNKVRVRPGLIRQYHQASSTESSRTKTERRKLTQQPITYRPAFDRRRTTMRIEEIEADLKTKPVHSRPEYDDYRHPVYKPEPSTEAPSSVQTETGNKRNQFRRRRPVYTTTSTEGTAARKPYELKNRFRGRRPTEKPTDKPEVQSETTTRSPVYNRYNHRTKLSERYNKKTENDEGTTEDQESNYSIKIQKYSPPDSDKWSPKISTDSFKPYNPNELTDDSKLRHLDTQVKDDELDIITARNEYEDILISVTPATNKNNRVNKKISDIPPTLEAYVEQSKSSKTEASDTASTFESMLEEVMKSLEEQDEDEYTSKVMKHKGGEIGEIPPEQIITSGVNYSLKSTSPVQEETTTFEPAIEEQAHSNNEEEPNSKSRRRGFWKKVKVRPIKESFEVAESQYYPNTVNTLGESVSKIFSEKSSEYKKNKITVTTYKPNYKFIKDFFDNDDSLFDVTPDIDIPKINVTRQPIEQTEKIGLTTESSTLKERTSENSNINPGDMDWGTGSPDPTLEDASYYTEATQPTIDRSDGFSFMEYLFGMTSNEESHPTKTENNEELNINTTPDVFVTESTKGTTDSYIPEEITAETITESTVVTENINKVKNNATGQSMNIESSSISSFMDPSNVISTSMSTEISHETEICFRGKCIKTKKDIL